jgi:hypothetical protein
MTNMPYLTHRVCNICANGVCRQFSLSLTVLDSLLSFAAGLVPNCCSCTFYANLRHAVSSYFSSVFFSHIRAVSVSSALYIVPSKKTDAVIIFIQYQHGSRNGGGNTGPLISNRLKLLLRRFYVRFLLTSILFYG